MIGGYFPNSARCFSIVGRTKPGGACCGSPTAIEMAASPGSTPSSNFASRVNGETGRAEKLAIAPDYSRVRTKRTPVTARCYRPHRGAVELYFGRNARNTVRVGGGASQCCEKEHRAIPPPDPSSALTRLKRINRPTAGRYQINERRDPSSGKKRRAPRGRIPGRPCLRPRCRCRVSLSAPFRRVASGRDLPSLPLSTRASRS